MFTGSFPSSTEGATVSVRDPLHGTIELEFWESELLEHPCIQRLRNIKQLGFADIPYPGATHSRFIHSIGAMWIATRMWDSLERQLQLTEEQALPLRRMLRIAVLLHDIGHAPLSHISEHLMPPLQELQLPTWVHNTPQLRLAEHEDFTLKLLLDSSLTPTLRQFNLSPEQIAQLICGQKSPATDGFIIDGVDLFPLMRQIVSSELDADRMDYLLRDSLFTGVSYGKFDLDWIIRNLRPISKDSQVFLGFSSRALFAFEDFLLSRYHMFWSVYYHQTAVCYQEMLLRYAESEDTSYQLPSNVNEYLATDDLQLIQRLRNSPNEWARRIVERRPYHKILESLLPMGPPDRHTHSTETRHQPLRWTPTGSASFDRLDALSSTPLPDTIHPSQTAALCQALCDELQRQKIPHFRTESKWVLSRYFRKDKAHEPPLFVIDESFQRAVALEQYSPLYRRYAEASLLVRVYCDPARCDEAHVILQQIGGAFA